MAPAPERRLAAILAADIVGYSRAMEIDEEGTLDRLNHLRSKVIEPTVAARSGRIFKTTGDGFLAEFASSVYALRCAIELQQVITELTEGLPTDQQLRFRMGVHIGDVMVEDDDIFGNGVNVAARLEGLAEADGVCISERVFEDAEKLIDADFRFLGPVQVKNIERPIRAYACAPKATAVDRTEAAGTPTARRPRRRRALYLTASVAALAACILGVGFWLTGPDIRTSPGADEAATSTVEQRPSIAVLPFANLSGAEDQRYFADGITEDLITDLSKISELFVISRNSAFAYRDQDIRPSDVAAELGVRYILLGSVRRADERIRINARLVDAGNDETIWADRYDGEQADVFALQDSVTRRIVSVLSVRLSNDEEAALARQETATPAAHDAFLKGWGRYLAQTPEDLRAAIEHFQAAIALDPEYGRAHAALAAAYWQIARRWWHADFDFANVHRARVHAEELLRRALKYETPLAHQIAASMLSQQGRHTEALAEGARAIALDPNDADSFVALAGALSLAGEPDQALALIDRAMRLNPKSPGWYFHERGLAEFGLESFAAAASSLERALEINPDDRWSKRLLAAVYGHLERVADAAAIVETANASWLNTDPFTVRAIAYWYPYKEAADRERLVEGLRKANLPD